MLERVEEIAKRGVTAIELARYFPTPLLRLVGDEVADGQWSVAEGAPRPLALFDAVRVDFPCIASCTTPAATGAICRTGYC